MFEGGIYQDLFTTEKNNINVKARHEKRVYNFKINAIVTGQKVSDATIIEIDEVLA